ncbi:MAG: lysylphosphatidylglycerol synthase domain-containing protein, partial [Oscillospiraceae bacterium]|nr:lysylphosphatidylglycerol synthase domain-containing protein [Oscillospiraceae bacterium]
MKSKRSRTYLVSGLTLALIFVAIILVFRDVLPDIVKDLSTVPFWGVLLLLALGFAYEVMESVLCLVIIHHKKPDCTFIDALRVTFLGVFGNITTLGAGTLPMQSFYLYRRGLDAGSGLGIMASEYVLHKISVLIYATVALLLGGDWLEQSASGLARYLLIGYVIGALIVIALTLLYTWDKVLKLVLMLLGKLPHTPKWDERREKWANSLTELNREAKKVLLVPSIRVKGIAVSLVKLFVLYSIP